MKLQLEIEVPDEYDREDAVEALNCFVDVGDLQDSVIGYLKDQASERSRELGVGR